MYVIAEPTVFEIEEMLDLVAMRANLASVAPLDKSGLSYAETLSRGWCYLFYDEHTLIPLGFCSFTWLKNKRIPFLAFGCTQFAKPHHLFIARRAMLRVIRNALNNQTNVYITDRRIEKLAEKSGFKRLKSKKNKNIWARVKNGIQKQKD